MPSESVAPCDHGDHLREATCKPPVPAHLANVDFLIRETEIELYKAISAKPVGLERLERIKVHMAHIGDELDELLEEYK